MSKDKWLSREEICNPPNMYVRKLYRLIKQGKVQKRKIDGIMKYRIIDTVNDTDTRKVSKTGKVDTQEQSNKATLDTIDNLSKMVSDLTQQLKDKDQQLLRKQEQIEKLRHYEIEYHKAQSQIKLLEPAQHELEKLRKELEKEKNLSTWQKIKRIFVE